MFDITPDDIAQLNDTDLRELVGRLCEAELASRGLSAVAVTWGGNQTAADGGLDVRVALGPDVSIDGFVPRASTGFQVKASDMPRAKILSEMRPSGTIRPAIQELADEAGAYVMISSDGSTADSALRSRQDALRTALDDVASADKLHTDFYDRTRVASWVRQHPGLITWVKERVGRSVVGWRPYGSWSGAADSVDAEYLFDDKLRLHLGGHRDVPAQSVIQAIDELRDQLAQPGKIARLVGLSGVGKTRLAQALFDARIGSRPLPPSQAVYTNLSDNPDPQPVGMASDLIANRLRSVLIVDNCPPELHRRLSELCSGQASSVSVLTVEYDVRDDQPEGTRVVTLEASSVELIEKLIARRYSHLSQVDARTIAEASGGNARIAIALAETVERSDSIAGLSNDELFDRLFRQRQDSNNALLLAAQACSLVYSFQGEALTEDDAELPHLAALADQAATETYRCVSELLRRDLIQRRGVWRAVLPHAIANRLAARALEDIPNDLIDQQLVTGGTDRLARSFSRRLSFLHDHPKAVAIVQKWLAPNGLLGNVAAFSDLGRAMFGNVAPVQPEAALTALERVDENQPETAATVWQQHLSLLRSLAYDPLLFERSARLLVRAAMGNENRSKAKQAADAFDSLFTIYLSGTHATIEQRLQVLEQLLRSSDAEARTLGLAALSNTLEATHFSSGYRFEFGARSRDHGYRPQSRDDVTRWYGAALTLIERLALTEGVLKPELRDLLGRHFRGLWTWAHMHDELETLSRRIAADGFWREGWGACRQVMQFDMDRSLPDVVSRLSALEAALRPANLSERVRAVVLGDRFGGLSLDDMDGDDDPTSAYERLEAVANDLGVAVAVDDAVFAELLPELLRGGNRAWSFGRGLAGASADVHAIWKNLVEALAQIPPDQRNVQVLRGLLAELWIRDRDLAQNLLDAALDQQVLLTIFPMLGSSVDLDERGVERMKRALSTGQVPIWTYRNLTFGRITNQLAGGVLKDLLLLIASQPDGFHVALEILHMRFFSDRADKRELDPELLSAGQELLRHVVFRKHNQQDDYNLAEMVRFCLVGPDAGPIAAAVTGRLRQAVATYEIHAFGSEDFLKALLEVQPGAVLDALFEGDETWRQEGVRMFGHAGGHRVNPADAVTCETLTAWCATDPEARYPLAASIITFTGGQDADGALLWSEQAKALLVGALDAKSVLVVFIERFRPTHWSGSRAALIEGNARLLDSPVLHTLSGVGPLLTEARAQLVQEVARARQWETEYDRRQDERFE